MYLNDRIKEISVDDAKAIHWLVWLLENPQSPIALPGKISLYNHDCLHAILGQDLSSSGEASVVGYCMGNDPKTCQRHVLIFRIFSRYLYPRKFRFSAEDWIDFIAGFFYGRTRSVKDIHEIDFFQVKEDIPISQIRRSLGICPQDLNLIKSSFQSQSLKQNQKKAEIYKWSSAFFGILGGVMVASNTFLTPFSFIFLALSSFQFLLASLIMKDIGFIALSGSTFVFVDLLGILRWLIIEK